MRPLLLLLAAVGCSHAAEAAPPPKPAPSTTQQAARQRTVEEQARQELCIDKWLADHDLNLYGDPPGTMYAGGTPLFDETTGQRKERVPYLLAKLPELETACP